MLIKFKRFFELNFDFLQNLEYINVPLKDQLSEKKDLIALKPGELKAGETYAFQVDYNTSG